MKVLLITLRPLLVFDISKLKNEEIKGFSIEKIKDSDAGYLIVPRTKEGEQRTLNLTFN